MENGAFALLEQMLGVKASMYSYLVGLKAIQFGMTYNLCSFFVHVRAIKALARLRITLPACICDKYGDIFHLFFTGI